MKKDFHEWHGVKQHIQDANQRRFCEEREVRWCSIGLNVGSEMDGKGERYTRPVLIVKKMTKNTCLCIPLTTQNRDEAYRIVIDLIDGIQRQAILSQIRLIDTKRLRELAGIIDTNQFEKIKRAIVDMIE